MTTIKEDIEKLPPELQEEALDFIQFLLEKKLHHKQRKLRLG